MTNRFTRHTIETAPAASRPTLEGAKKGWGFVPNLHATLAEAPTALAAYGTLFELVGQGTLTPAEQQVAFMTANVFHECEYCTSGHSVLAKNAGLDGVAIEALREGQPLADGRLQALRAYSLALIQNRGNVPAATEEAFFAAGYSPAQALELLVVLAAKTISNYANHMAGTELDAFMAGTAWVAPSRRAASAA